MQTYATGLCLYTYLGFKNDVKLRSCVETLSLQMYCLYTENQDLKIEWSVPVNLLMIRNRFTVIWGSHLEAFIYSLLDYVNHWSEIKNWMTAKINWKQ